MSEDKTIYCQSCAMPLAKPEDFGTEKDGLKSKEFCSLCFKNGKFIDPDVTMEEMIKISAKGWSEFDPKVSYEQAEEEMKKIAPTLKRWN